MKELEEFLVNNKESIRFDIEEHVRNFLKNEEDFKGVFSFSYHMAFLEFVSSCLIEILMSSNFSMEHIFELVDPFSLEDLLNGFFVDKEFYRKQ